MGYIYTFLWSLVPIFELRGAIPFGVFKYGLTIVEATLVSILGGIVITFIWVSILTPIINVLEKRIPILHKIIIKIFSKTKKHHSKKMAKLGHIFLVILVAVPIPGSGALTGAVLSYAYGIPRMLAFRLISTGVILSGILVGILTYFGGSLVKMLSSLT